METSKSSDAASASELRAPRRRFIEPRSPQEILVLATLLRDRVRDHGTETEELHRILSLLERSVYMDAISSAFTELLEDTDQLRDPDEEGYASSAVAISLDRDSFSVLDIAVSLKEISGEQLAYVLDVAKRHGLQVRELAGWLRLSVNDPIDPMETADEPEEALA